MRTGKSLLRATFVGAAVLGCAQPVAAQTDVSNPVVVEMFLSQACKSCPPAADYMTELALRPDVVALAWHIDYWNLLSNRKYGRWKDPYSRSVFADRQRKYNRRIRKRSTVFTPQAIINGDESEIGSKREDIEALIVEARSSAPEASVEMAPSADVLTVKISSGAGMREAYLVTFLDTSTVPITGGDNAGVVFAEANVVTDVQRLGAVSQGWGAFKAPAPGEDMGCAVLVQEPDQGRIVAAKYCP